MPAILKHNSTGAGVSIARRAVGLQIGDVKYQTTSFDQNLLFLISYFVAFMQSFHYFDDFYHNLDFFFMLTHRKNRHFLSLFTKLPLYKFMFSVTDFNTSLF